MEIPKQAIDIEEKNVYYIYLFYAEERWWAFGYSAYYMSIIYPELEAMEGLFTDSEEGMPCIHVPDHYLVKLSDCYNTLVSDKHIQISAPPIAYCHRKASDKWCATLIVT